MLLNQRENLSGKPVMRVNNVKLPDQRACAEKAVLKRTAHVPRLAREVAVMIESAAMQENAVLSFVIAQARSVTREEVNFVPERRQRAGEFRDVNTGTADENRVERIPGE
jgi:hypothetical protein